jgi:DNA-binding MarR family transcriptional regulator
MQEDVDQDVALFDALTRVLVGVAWDSAHAAPVGMTFPQTRLLLVLLDLGKVASSRLAEAMGVNASSITRHADKLEARGYLRRGTDERNRSVVTLDVTEAGRAAGGRCWLGDMPHWVRSSGGSTPGTGRRRRTRRGRSSPPLMPSQLLRRPDRRRCERRSEAEEAGHARRAPRRLHGAPARVGHRRGCRRRCS